MQANHSAMVLYAYLKSKNDSAGSLLIRHIHLLLPLLLSVIGRYHNFVLLIPFTVIMTAVNYIIRWH